MAAEVTNSDLSFGGRYIGSGKPGSRPSISFKASSTACGCFRTTRATCSNVFAASKTPSKVIAIRIVLVLRCTYCKPHNVVSPTMGASHNSKEPGGPCVAALTVEYKVTCWRRCRASFLPQGEREPQL